MTSPNIESLIGSLEQDLPDEHAISRKGGCYYTMVGGKPTKTLHTSYKVKGLQGCKGAWTATQLYQECHLITADMKAADINESYDDVAWRTGKGKGALLVPGGDVGRDGQSGKKSGERLPPEYRTHQINVSAYNSAIAAGEPLLCCLDWDAGSDMNIVPELWRTLPYSKSMSGKFHFWFKITNVPENRPKTNQGLFQPVLDGIDVGPKAADLFLCGKQAVWETQHSVMHNFKPADGLPVIDFTEILQPYLLMDKFSKPVPTPKKKKDTPDSVLFERTGEGQLATKDEVTYLLNSIAPDMDLYDGWLQITTFMRWNCKFAGSRELWADWCSRAKPRADGTARKRTLTDHQEKTWHSTSDQGFDIEYVRGIARRTLEGAKRVRTFLHQSMLKAQLSESNFTRTPQFGDQHVAKITKALLPPLLFDGKSKSPNDSLFKMDLDTGVYTEFVGTNVTQFIDKKVIPFIEDELLPRIGKRSVEIGNLIADLGDEADADEPTKREISELTREAEYLTGKRSEKGALEKEGLIHRVEKKLRSLFDATPKQKVCIQLRSDCNFSGPPYLPDLWNSGDNTQWLFPMSNGVIDLEHMIFRPARREEMILHTTGREYKPATRTEGDPKKFPGGDVKKWLLDQLCEVYATDNQLMTKLVVTASSLRGFQFFQFFVLECGSGSNSKGAIFRLIKKCFGHLCGELKAQALQMEVSGPDSATSYLANKRWCRVVGSKEPPAGKSLKINIIKEISGGDPISVRMLYGNEFELVPQFHIVLQCNARPPLEEAAAHKSEKQAMDRRLLMMVNPFQFDNGNSPISKPASNAPVLFLTESDVHDAFTEILCTVFQKYVKPFFEQNINMIKEAHKLDMGWKYPEDWEAELKKWKNQADNIAIYMLDVYAPATTPPGFIQHGAFFDIKVEMKKNRNVFKSKVKDYSSCFNDLQQRETLAQCYDMYKDSIPKGQKAESKAHFSSRLKALGYGITKNVPSSIGGYEKCEPAVFGITAKEDEDEEEIDSIFDNTQGPSKAPGSFYDVILNDQPLATNMFETVDVSDIPSETLNTTVESEAISNALAGMSQDEPLADDMEGDLFDVSHH